jgi:hypothetical protein
MGDSRGVRCENLDGTLGMENGCTCKVYSKRYHGMPVKMLDKSGEIAYTSYCQPQVWGDGCCKDLFEDAKV